MLSNDCKVLEQIMWLNMKQVFYIALTKELLEKIFILLKKMKKKMLFWNTKKQKKQQ